jgi:hypothetical protein
MSPNLYDATDYAQSVPKQVSRLGLLAGSSAREGAIRATLTPDLLDLQRSRQDTSYTKVTRLLAFTLFTLQHLPCSSI